MRRSFVTLGIACCVLVGAAPVAAQGRAITPDLQALAAGRAGPIPAVATLRWVDDAKGKPALRIRSRTDDTVVPLAGIEFDDGVIEFDALGQSGPPQSSFLGIAFRVAGSAHDAVYFRPFNFRATQERQAHSVQYVSMPAYGWHVLRTTRPGRYEKPIVPAPDGDAWFHVRIVVRNPKVSVYVDGAREPLRGQRAAIGAHRPVPAASD